MDGEDGTRAAWSAAQKKEYRRFVRTHHPDVGGDPDVFAAGLQRFGDTGPANADSVIFVRRRRGLLGLLERMATRRHRRRRPRRVI